MWQTTFTLTLGFVLTVLIGGAYASYLQQRSWQHQNQSRLDEEERKQASEICMALSELLDKRRYRTLRLVQAIEQQVQGEGSDRELRDRRSQYEKALADWNDQLTTRLVGVGVYFGHDLRDFLTGTIDKRFQAADEGIEKLHRQVAATPDTVEGIDTTDVAKLLDALRQDAYKLSSAMMLRIRKGAIGRTAPNQLQRSSGGQSPTGAWSVPGAGHSTSRKPPRH